MQPARKAEARTSRAGTEPLPTPRAACAGPSRKPRKARGARRTRQTSPHATSHDQAGGPAERGGAEVSHAAERATAARRRGSAQPRRPSPRGLRRQAASSSGRTFRQRAALPCGPSPAGLPRRQGLAGSGPRPLASVVAPPWRRAAMTPASAASPAACSPSFAAGRAARSSLLGSGRLAPQRRPREVKGWALGKTREPTDDSVEVTAGRGWARTGWTASRISAGDTTFAFGSAFPDKP